MTLTVSRTESRQVMRATDLSTTMSLIPEQDTSNIDNPLLRVAAGDTTAVQDCIDRYGKIVWTLAKRFSPNWADAEDAVQEIFMELWQKADRFDPARSADLTFVTMIARRRLIDRFRRNNQRMDTHSISSDDAIFSPNELESEFETIDEAAKAQQCVERLKSQSQTVLRMSIHEGQSHSKIAESLGLPLGTVKTLARRALMQVRSCMERMQSIGGWSPSGSSGS